MKHINFYSIFLLSLCIIGKVLQLIYISKCLFVFALFNFCALVREFYKSSAADKCIVQQWSTCLTLFSISCAFHRVLLTTQRVGVVVSQQLLWLAWLGMARLSMRSCPIIRIDLFTIKIRVPLDNTCSLLRTVCSILGFWELISTPMNSRQFS